MCFYPWQPDQATKLTLQACKPHLLLPLHARSLAASLATKRRLREYCTMLASKAAAASAKRRRLQLMREDTEDADEEEDSESPSRSPSAMKSGKQAAQTRSKAEAGGKAAVWTSNSR